MGLGVYPVKRGTAERLGMADFKGRGYGFSIFDVGLEIGVDPEQAPNKKRVYEKLPRNHRFFHDCFRENQARLISWQISGLKEHESWFVTLTFKKYLPEVQADRILKTWLHRLCDAHNLLNGGHGLRWIAAKEWQKRQVIHYHILLNGVRLGFMSRKRWEAKWEAENLAGFARIYDARKKAAPYLAKYTSKTRGGDLQRGGTWRGISAPDFISCCGP